MACWFDSAEHQKFLDRMCIKHTPITLLFEDDPDYRLDCIPDWCTGDVLCVIVDQDDDGYGAKRGTKIHVDPEEIGGVIVRENQRESQPE